MHFDYFRKAMGLPSNTSGVGLLTDFSIMKMSLRFERERAKLQAKLDFSLVPDVVQRQVSYYKSLKVKKVTRFTSSSKVESVKMRNTYVQNIPPKTQHSRANQFLSSYPQ